MNFLLKIFPKNMVFQYKVIGLFFTYLFVFSNNQVELYQKIMNPIPFNQITNYSIYEEKIISKYDIAGNYGILNISFSITNIMGSPKFEAISYDVINSFNDFGSINHTNLCSINQNDLYLSFRFAVDRVIIREHLYDFLIMNKKVYMTFYNQLNHSINIISYYFENQKSFNQSDFLIFPINENFKTNLKGIVANENYIILYNTSAMLIYDLTTLPSSFEKNGKVVLFNEQIFFVKKIGINGNLSVVVYNAIEFWVFNSTINITGKCNMFNEIKIINDIEIYNKQLIISTNAGLYLTDPILALNSKLDLNKKILSISNTSLLATYGNTLFISIYPLINIKDKYVFAYEFSLEMMNTTREFSIKSKETPIKLLMDKDYVYFQMENSNKVFVVKHSVPNIFSTAPYISQIIENVYNSKIFLPLITNISTSEITYLIGYSDSARNNFMEVKYQQLSTIVCNGSKFNEFSEGKYNIEIRRYSLECSKKDSEKKHGKLFYLCYDSKILQLFKNEGESLLNQTFVLSFILLFLVCILLLSIIIYVIRNRKKQREIEEQNQKMPIEFLHKEDKIAYASLSNNNGEDSERPFDLNRSKENKDSSVKEDANTLKIEKDN